MKEYRVRVEDRYAKKFIDDTRDYVTYIELITLPLPRRGTPPKCPDCGETEHYRIIYTDDDMTEVDFFDCMMCRCHWKPDDSLPRKVIK